MLNGYMDSTIIFHPTNNRMVVIKHMELDAKAMNAVERALQNTQSPRRLSFVTILIVPHRLQCLSPALRRMRYTARHQSLRTG